MPLTVTSSHDPAIMDTIVGDDYAHFYDRNKRGWVRYSLVPAGETPIGDYIKGLASGRLRIFEGKLFRMNGSYSTGRSM